MTRLVRLEVLKTRTVRSNLGLLAVSAALTALFASLEASRAGRSGGTVASLATASGLTTVTTVTGWSMLFAAVLGVTITAGELRHGTLTLTYLTVPHRSRVLAAKAVAGAGAGAVFGLTSGAIATGVGLLFATSRHEPLALGAGTLVAHAFGAALGAALFGAVGVGLGSIVRSQVGGTIAVFVWGLVLESLVGGLFTSVRPYLPYTAATTLAGIKLGGAAFGPARSVTGGSPLPLAAAAALVAAVAALLAVVAARVTVPRDVT